jgi:hypothetical protein
MYGPNTPKNLAIDGGIKRIAMTKLREIVLRDTKRFMHMSTGLNEQHKYVKAFFPSFLVNIYPKSEKIKPILVENAPKWKTIIIDRETDSWFQTDSWKRSYSKKRKIAMQFCDFYEDSYKQKSISMQFFTFTRADHAKMPFKDMVNLLKKTYKNNDYPVLGYFWVAEVSRGFHWHYHLAICTRRINIKGKGMPKWMKFDKQWGQITFVVFVKKSIRNYLSKYFSKSNPYRLVNARSTGKSSKYTLHTSATHIL